MEQSVRVMFENDWLMLSGSCGAISMFEYDWLTLLGCHGAISTRDYI